MHVHMYAVDHSSVPVISMAAWRRLECCVNACACESREGARSSMVKAMKQLAYFGAAVVLLVLVYYYAASGPPNLVISLPSPPVPDVTPPNVNIASLHASLPTNSPAESQTTPSSPPISVTMTTSTERNPKKLKVVTLQRSPDETLKPPPSHQASPSKGDAPVVATAPSPALIGELGHLFNAEMRGHVNFDLWHWIVGFFVDDMRFKRTFPNAPDERKTKAALTSFFSEVDPNDVGGKYAHKVYGYIIAPLDGSYTFSVEFTKFTAATEVEFWLSSDSNPANIKQVLNLWYPAGLLSNDMRRKRVIASKQLESQPTPLKANSAYYFEFFQKSYDGTVTVEIQWKLPGATLYGTIPGDNLAMAVQLDKNGQFIDSPVAAVLKGRDLPSAKLQSHQFVSFIGDTVVPITRLDVLPHCEFTSVYAYEHIVKQYRGIREVVESSVLPGTEGSKVISEQTANHIVDVYKKALLANKNYSEATLRYLEETSNKDQGMRYLLEMDIVMTEQKKTVHTSDYVYIAPGKELCYPTNFQWTMDADVHFVVSVKNLGIWVKHLIHNMEHIYSVTGDDHFQLIIVDYGSEDLNVEAELQQSSLKRWKFVPKTGPFSRSAGLQAGIEAVTDPDSIVMTIDMHLTLPPGFVSYVRRHVVRGKMGFAPMFFRLKPGFTDVHIHGRWEFQTYGLFGLYRDDWDTSGGFSIEKYKYKWGGEDWDLLDKALSKGFETYRTRYPGLMHYHHTKVGMWTGSRR